MKQTTHFLSLIVPVYKKEKIIVENVLELKKVLDEIRYDYEIICVVDGMVDKAFEVLKKAKIPKVSVVAYEKNQGKGFALRLGMARAKGDYVMFIDSGMDINPNGISMLLEHMEWYNADIIVGSKRHPASMVNYTFLRRILSFGYHAMVKILFGISIKDTQAGIKIFRKEVLEKVLPRVLEKRFTADLEMLVVAKQFGFDRIFEAPIKLDYDFSASTAANMNAIKGMFLDTLAIFYRSKILNYYRKLKIPQNNRFNFDLDEFEN